MMRKLLNIKKQIATCGIRTQAKLIKTNSSLIAQIGIRQLSVCRGRYVPMYCGGRFVPVMCRHSRHRLDPLRDGSTTVTEVITLRN